MFSSLITAVEIHEGVTGIGEYAFNACSNLESVVLPASITNIGDCAFLTCDSLNAIRFGGTQTQWEGIQIGTDNEVFLSASVTYVIASGFCGGDTARTSTATKMRHGHWIVTEHLP